MHALQGDGVVDQTAIETAAENLEVRYDLHKGVALGGPLGETDTEDAIADPQAVVASRDPFSHPGEVDAHDERIRRDVGQASQEAVVQRVDPREAHADEHRVIVCGNRQILDRCRLPEASHRKSAHPNLPAIRREIPLSRVPASVVDPWLDGSSGLPPIWLIKSSRVRPCC